MQQLDISFGRTLRDRGINQAICHADNRSKGWSERAYNVLEFYVNTPREPGFTFMTEDLRIYANEVMKLAVPPSPKAWGGIIKRANHRGLIEFVRFQAVSSSVAHCRPGSVWRKKV